MNAWSESGLATVEGCPEAHRLKKIKAPVILPDILTIGSLAHSAIERYVDACSRAGEKELLTEIPDLVWKVCQAQKKPVREELREDVQDLLLRFAERTEIKVTNPETEVEAAFDRIWRRVGWKDWDVCRFRAKLDLVERFEDSVRVTDWKTGWKIPPRAEAESGSQLRTYAFVLSKLYPRVEEFRCRYVYVRQGVEYEFTLGRDDVAGVQKDLEERMARADEIVRKNPGATPGPNCDGCFYRGSCSTYAARPRDHLPEFSEDLAAYYLLLKAKLKDVDEAIRTRVGVEGPVKLPGGKELAFEVQSRWGIEEARDGISALVELGVKPEDVYRKVNLPKSAIWSLLSAKLIPDRDARRKAVEDFLVRFGATTPTIMLKARTQEGEKK